jgi:hypothetical protein
MVRFLRPLAATRVAAPSRHTFEKCGHSHAAGIYSAFASHVDAPASLYSIASVQRRYKEPKRRTANVISEGASFRSRCRETEPVWPGETNWQLVETPADSRAQCSLRGRALSRNMVRFLLGSSRTVSTRALSRLNSTLASKQRHCPHRACPLPYCICTV